MWVTQGSEYWFIMGPAGNKEALKNADVHEKSVNFSFLVMVKHLCMLTIRMCVWEVKKKQKRDGCLESVSF